MVQIKISDQAHIPPATSLELARCCRPRLRRCPDWQHLPEQVQVQRKYDGIAAVVICGKVWSQTSQIHAPAIEEAFTGCGDAVIEVVSTLDGRSTVADTLHLRAHQPELLCARVIKGHCPDHPQVQRAWQQTVQREDLPGLWQQVLADGWEGIVIDQQWKAKAAYTADLLAVARCLDEQGSTVAVLVAVAHSSGLLTAGEIACTDQLDAMPSIAGPALPASTGAQLDWIEPTPIEVQIQTSTTAQGWDLSRTRAGLELVSGASSLAVSGELLRLRSDKRPTPADCGPQQLGLVLPQRAAQAARPGQIIELCTFYRDCGDDAAVRKWAIIHHDRPGYHSWLVHHTDYSPARQQRLRRTVRVAGSLEHAQQIMDAWIADTSLSRWSEYAG